MAVKKLWTIDRACGHTTTGQTSPTARPTGVPVTPLAGRTRLHRLLADRP
ncbi:hypothetical protein [Streptomyces decoyicus]|nr:hypothetical protein K7C20_07720 [Streptomyces decoyicus]